MYNVYPKLRRLKVGRVKVRQPFLKHTFYSHSVQNFNKRTKEMFIDILFQEIKVLKEYSLHEMNI